MKSNFTVLDARRSAALLLGIALLARLIAPAALGQTQPLISVSLNDSADAQIFRGMPLLVSIKLMHPNLFGTNAAPIVLASSSGAWTNSVQLTILDALSNSVSWPLNTRIAPGNTFTLDNSRFAQWDQWLTPQQTLNLSTGSYALSVTLNTTNVTLPGAWQGMVTSPPSNAEILDEPASLSENQAVNKYSQLALYDLFLNDPATALNQVNQLLGLFPTNQTGLRLKAMTLTALGKISDAQDVCNQALTQFYSSHTNAQEPPQNLIMLQGQIERALLNPQLRVQPTNGGQFAFNWPAHPALNYSILQSSNLVIWSLFASNFGVLSNNYIFTVPVTNSRQFFRLSHD